MTQKRYNKQFSSSCKTFWEKIHFSKISFLYNWHTQAIAYVKEYAKSKNVQVIEFELEPQFRCNGSDGFINWLNNTLAIKNTAKVIWNEGDESTFDFIQNAITMRIIY